MDRASNLYVSGKTRGTAAAGAQQRPESSFCSREWAGLGGFGRGLAHSAAASRALVVLAAF